MKITVFMKYSENIKFSNEMPYRLVSLLEKLQILSKSINFSEIEEILHKITGFGQKLQFCQANRLPFSPFH